MIDYIVALETRRGRKVRFEELEALVERLVAKAFGEGERPVDGRKEFTVFNLAAPIRAWVERMGTAQGRKLAWAKREKLLARMIREYLRDDVERLTYAEDVELKLFAVKYAPR